jgi:hypothetical protein
LVFGAFTIAISTRLPDDGFWGTVSSGWTTNLGPDNLRAALGRFWWALVPTMDDWWSTASLGSDLPSLAPWIPWLGGALFVAFLVSLRSSPIIVAVYALGVSAMALFQEMRYPGGMRHVGHFFILLLACGWLLKRDTAPRRRLPIYWALLSFALVFQLVSTIRATRKELKEPFSSALEAADFLRPLLSDDARIIGSGDHQSSAVAGYLDRWFVFAETGDHAYSVTFHNRRHGADNNVLFGLASESLATGAPVFFVLTHPLDATSQQGLTASELHVTREAIVRDERYWIYRLGRTPL